MYEYALAKGTVIQGGIMPGSDGVRYQYRVDEVLGQGGFGITYKVSSRVKMGNIWLKERQTFAMKEHFVKGHCYRGADGVSMEYSKASANDVEDSLRDFLREGKRLAEICKGCPNIVDVNEVISANNTAYYIMEYIEGGDLRNYKGIDEKKAVNIICEVAKAVEHIHNQHILHLDIKPENIVVGKNQEGKEIPVLIDFGVSRHFTNSGSLTTTHKDAMASKGFAPQEQFAGISKFSPEVDVYALAATLFYLIVGREPKSAFERMPNDVERALPSSVSERTRTALVHALKVQAHERTKTVKEFVSELKTGKINQTVEVLKEELVSGTIVKGGYADYQIIGQKSKGDCYIEYKATRYTGEQSLSNATMKANYTIYEYYVKGIHQRLKDSAVEQKYPNEEALIVFLKLSRQKTGLDIGNNSHVADTSHNHEVFKANGTYYIVVKDGSRIEKPKAPEPPHPPVPDPDPDSNIWKKIGLAVVCAIVIIVILVVWMIPEAKTEPVSDPIPADTDNVLVNPVIPQTEPEVSPDTPKNEPKKVADPSTPQKEVKQEPVKQQVIVVQPKETNEQKYNRALKDGDWATIRKLANEGYTAASGALAKHYVTSTATSENHKQAYYWAQRASGADKKYVMDILEKYGFLVNGKPVVE
jgi:serine/threonine protein kinase